jgi:two-component system NarL family sensor kinase
VVRLRRLALGTTAAAAVTRFVLAGLLAASIIAAGAFWVVSRNAVSEATRNAQEVAAIDGRSIVGPAITDGVASGDPAALALLDQVVHDRVLSKRVVRVKLWSTDGTVLYSDAASAIGRKFVLGDEERAAIKNGTVVADVSNLNRPENLTEKPFGRLLEVYLPVESASGRVFLFETYQEYRTIDEDQRRIWSSFFPVLAGGMLLLFAVQVPLAWRLARDLEKSQVEQEALLKRALQASEAERRTIARDLHDGVVQTLAGAAMSMSAAARRPQGTSSELIEALDLGAAAARQAARELRTLIVEIAPPDMHGGRLEGALADMLATVRPSGTTSTVSAAGVDSLNRDQAALLYRAAQEAARNAAAHSGATSIDVSVSTGPGWAELQVADNGRGFTADQVIARQREGHVGLAMLKTLVEDAGGQLLLASRAGSGSTITVRIPA